MQIKRFNSKLLLTSGIILLASSGASLAARFSQIDTNGDGYLNETELVSYFGKAGSYLLKEHDANGDGSISSVEMTESSSQYRNSDSNELAKREFAALKAAAEKATAEKAAESAAEKVAKKADKKKAAAKKAARKADKKKAAAKKAGRKASKKTAKKAGIN